MSVPQWGDFEADAAFNGHQTSHIEYNNGLFGQVVVDAEHELVQVITTDSDGEVIMFDQFDLTQTAAVVRHLDKLKPRSVSCDFINQFNGAVQEALRSRAHA
jgi:hypothetical protein